MLSTRRSTGERFSSHAPDSRCGDPHTLFSLFLHDHDFPTLMNLNVNIFGDGGFAAGVATDGLRTAGLWVRETRR